MANDEWQMANGEWQMANGEWRMRNSGYPAVDDWQLMTDHRLNANAEIILPEYPARASRSPPARRQPEAVCVRVRVSSAGQSWIAVTVALSRLRVIVCASLPVAAIRVT